jgi:hypothetical protein
MIYAIQWLASVSWLRVSAIGRQAHSLPSAIERCHIAFPICPVLLSLLLIASPNVILNPLRDLTAVFHLSTGRQAATLVVALATLLIICTLLITSLVGQLRMLRHRISELK